MRREQVARIQRARLYGGMLESISRRGYRATTVADVIGLAGVSRRAFYEHFNDKAGCLLATHNSIVAHARAGVVKAWGAQCGWSNQLHAACRSLFDEVLEHPKGARLVLVDSLGIDPGARDRVQLANIVFERLLLVGLYRQTSSRGRSPLVSARAIVGGVRHAIFVRMRRHREPELHTLADEVLDWVESYRASIDSASLMLRARPQANRSPRPAAFLAQKDAHSRIFAAMLQLVRENGFVDVRDSELARLARLPTQAFHSQFATKEVCVLQLLEAFGCELLELARAEMRTAHSWSLGVQQAMRVYTEYIAYNEALARLAFVDLFEVGPAILDHPVGVVEKITSLLTDHCPVASKSPDLTREALAGAIWAITFGYAATGRAAQLPASVDQLSFLVLAPYLGSREAMQAILVARTNRKLSP